MLLTELLSRKCLVLSAKNLSPSRFGLETAKPGLTMIIWSCHKSSRTEMVTRGIDRTPTSAGSLLVSLLRRSG
jgi:hypothetical protein